MSLSRLLYIANLLVILSFLLHLRPVSRTGDHVTRVAVSCVAGQFYYQPDTWTRPCPGPDAGCSQRIAGGVWESEGGRVGGREGGKGKAG